MARTLDPAARQAARAELLKLSLRDRVHAVVFAYENGVAVPGEAGEPES